ncbi:MAG: hypothetical protein ACTIJR_14330 [Brevibacterium linens]
MANTIVQGICFRCGRLKSLRWNHTLDRGECRACRAHRSPIETCTGCGRQRRVNARTDDGGAVCVTCYARDHHPEDACDECGMIGPLATRAGGKRPGAANLCGRCYRNPCRVCGVCGRLKRVALKATATSPDVCPTCYQAPVIDCSICGQQALGRRTTNHGRPRCFACQAAQQIDAALTGPDGVIRPELKPVRDALTELERPRSLLTNWHDLASLRLLTSIARGQVDLSHDALDARPQMFSVTYLRAMLVAAGTLPPRDENAARLHRYAADVVAEVSDPEMRGVLTRYARWHVVGRAKTDRHDRIAPNAAARCRGDIDTARAFLDHLSSGGYDLDDCPQDHLDAWITTDRSRRLGFVRWLKRGGYLRHVWLPEPVPAKDPAHDVDPEEQLALVRRLLHEPGSASIEDRAAACLILLYAQPVAKITALITSDIEVRDGETYLRLGSEPVLLIPPLDALVTALPVAKPFGAASRLADSRWLFTGKNAGTHLHPASLLRRMHQLGVTSRASRNTALLHLASTTPPAVFASLIGVSIGTATRWAGLAGASWNRYATLPR